MQVLVTAASRHGATDGIATIIATTLRDAGFDVDSRRPDEVVDITDYDAVIVGSGVYLGRWLPPAIDFIERLAPDLRERQVFVFSSGPLGDERTADEDPTDAWEVDDRIRAVDRRVFAGRLEPGQLGVAERTITTLIQAPAGDFRPWPDIVEWATEIARYLRQESPFPELAAAGP